MKWMPSCKEMTEICCEHDRKLGLFESVKFWIHLGMCKSCLVYKKQIEFMSSVMRKAMFERTKADENKVAQLEKEIIQRNSKIEG